MVWAVAKQQEHTCSSDGLDVDAVGVRCKPLKRRRGLSRFYSSKSQSFSSLELVQCTAFGNSALALAKRPSSFDLKRQAAGQHLLAALQQQRSHAGSPLGCRSGLASPTYGGMLSPMVEEVDCCCGLYAPECQDGNDSGEDEQHCGRCSTGPRSPQLFRSDDCDLVGELLASSGDIPLPCHACGYGRDRSASPPLSGIQLSLQGGFARFRNEMRDDVADSPQGSSSLLEGCSTADLEDDGASMSMAVYSGLPLQRQHYGRLLPMQHACAVADADCGFDPDGGMDTDTDEGHGRAPARRRGLAAIGCTQRRRSGGAGMQQQQQPRSGRLHAVSGLASSSLWGSTENLIAALRLSEQEQQRAARPPSSQPLPAPAGRGGPFGSGVSSGFSSVSYGGGAGVLSGSPPVFGNTPSSLATQSSSLATHCYSQSLSQMPSLLPSYYGRYSSEAL